MGIETEINLAINLTIRRIALLARLRLRPTAHDPALVKRGENLSICKAEREINKLNRSSEAPPPTDKACPDIGEAESMFR